MIGRLDIFEAQTFWLPDDRRNYIDLFYLTRWP